MISCSIQSSVEMEWSGDVDRAEDQIDGVCGAAIKSKTAAAAHISYNLIEARKGTKLYVNYN